MGFISKTMAREIIDYRKEPINVSLLINHIVKLPSKCLCSVSNFEKWGFSLLYVVNTDALLFKELKQGTVCAYLSWWVFCINHQTSLDTGGIMEKKQREHISQKMKTMRRSHVKCCPLSLTWLLYTWTDSMCVDLPKICTRSS